ncbi:DUF4007 family protein [Catenisphaera adipataccumulans]|uniref:DUF4007 domain-containing protein n=1 Tax=Catenisphaera adipataccumulans TaxID=700500 RepID=A0A7W8CW35_9FIRM|nr:DUF4007 family protein [Catenisphaera adipataccumulans]MBB5182682.1 hypothetical protein [Catenisphaera adipataccumulans]
MAMKFRAHETFFIRKGWLSKGMRYVSQKPDVFIDKNENPMDVLGIGTNMVKSLRYWLQAVGLTTEASKGRRVQTLTDFGQIVYHHDPYTEELGTLYLMQYKLVSNEKMAPSWYYFFNIFSMQEFVKDDFVEQIQNALKMQDMSVAVRSLEDDFTCIVNTYVPKYKSHPSKNSPENNITCPFGDLGLVDILNKKRKNVSYRKAIPSVKSFNPWVVMAVISEQAKEKKEIRLNELLTSPCNIGKVFNLDSISMLELLHEVEKLGEIKIIRTAGLDVIRINHDRTFEECVENYYDDIEGRNL